MAIKKENIYQKLLKIQKEVKALKKDKKSFSYEYVTGNKLLSFIRPLMDREGLLLKQEVTSIDNVRIDYETKKGSKEEMHTKVMMIFTWVDSETGEKDINLFGANGQNDWEKGFGSALTYAERYFLLKYFHIATDEDDVDNPDRTTSKAIAKKEAEDNKPKPVLEAGTETYISVFKGLQNGFKMEQVKGKYEVSEEIEAQLLKELGNENV